MKLAAVDLDGTLIDTSLVNSGAYRFALREKGLDVTDEFFMKNCFGRYYQDFIPALLGNNASPEDIEYIHERKKEFYSSCIPLGRRNNALVDILTALRSTGEWYTALVTTGSDRNAREILKAFDCEKLFDLILTSADVKKNKPDPEGYLKAMKHFGVEPENTLIFEDSSTGIAAAEASGAKILRIEKF